MTSPSRVLGVRGCRSDARFPTIAGGRPRPSSMSRTGCGGIDRPAGLSSAGRTTPRSTLLGYLGAQPLLLLPQLGRELGAEIRRLEDLPDLDFRVRAGVGVRAALDPLDRLFLRLHLPQPEAG